MNAGIGDLRTKLAELDQIQQKLDISIRQIADLQKLSEERPPEAVGDQAPDDDELRNWEAVSAMWFDVRDLVEDRIEGIWDGRIRRKYNSIPRYTYDEITDLLVRDQALTPDEADAINQMGQAFRSLRNRKIPVTRERVQEFRALRGRIGVEPAGD